MTIWESSKENSRTQVNDGKQQGWAAAPKENKNFFGGGISVHMELGYQYTIWSLWLFLENLSFYSEEKPPLPLPSLFTLLAGEAQQN